MAGEHVIRKIKPPSGPKFSGGIGTALSTKQPSFSQGIGSALSTKGRGSRKTGVGKYAQ